MIALLLVATLAVDDAPTTQMPTVPEGVVTGPLHWVRPPAGQFPAEPLSREITGVAFVRCEVQGDGRLADCEIVLEDPAGWGFGAAALAAMSEAQVEPHMAGTVVQQGTEFILPR